MVTCDNFKHLRIKCLAYLLQMINSYDYDYVPYNGSKCQLTILLPNQFNKRTIFWIVSITGLWLSPTLIICSIDIFDKRAFCFVGIESIGFFFLASILIMAMFNFQFWVRIKIGSWYYLTCCISLLFSHFLMCCLTN